jgi:hypothetical protein
MIAVAWDENDRPRVAPGTASPLLADLLETDVQDYLPRAREIAGAVRRLLRGQSSEAARFYGNIYELKLDPATATIANLFDESVVPERLSLVDFAQAIESWLAALEQRRA